jgi:hypothetical protein
MRNLWRTISFWVGVAPLLLCLQTSARADAFQFTFSTNLVGCGSTSTCAPVSGSGTFTTDAATLSPTYGNFEVYPVTSIVGTFDGLAMSIATGNNTPAAIEQATLALVPLYPIFFTAGGQLYNLQMQDGPHPAGTDNLLFSQNGNTFEAITLSISAVKVPEASEVAMAATGLFGLAILAWRKKRTLQTV